MHLQKLKKQHKVVTGKIKKLERFATYRIWRELKITYPENISKNNWRYIEITFDSFGKEYISFKVNVFNNSMNPPIDNFNINIEDYVLKLDEKGFDNYLENLQIDMDEEEEMKKYWIEEYKKGLKNNENA